MILEFAKDTRFDVPLEQSALEKLFYARDANARVGIACSGGADSVFLLLCTAQILGKNKKNLRVLHFNHKARGNAEKDEAFVRGLAEKLGIEFVAGRPEKGPEKMSEDVFRKMRMEFFERCSREMHLDCIAQGHHADDVAETTLMRLMRGSGLDGMCAPRAVSVHPCATFVRPLLELKKAAITAMLEKLGMGWREDETNAQTHFLRNRVRNVIIPEIEKACAGSFSNSAGRTRALLQEDSDALRKIFDDEISQANPEISGGAPLNSIKLTPILKAHASFIRRAAMLLISQNGLENKIRSGGVDAFVEKALKGKTFKSSVGGGFLHFDAQNSSISLEASPACAEFDIPLSIGKNILPCGGILRIKRITLGEAKKQAITGGDNDDSIRAYLDLSAAGTFEDGALSARTRMDGDEYAPMGSKTPKKLKKLLSAKKVPAAKRKGAIIVYNRKGEILWTPGLPPANAYRLGSGAAAIELTFEEIDIS